MAHHSLRTALLCLTLAIIGCTFIKCDTSLTAEGDDEAFSDPDKAAKVQKIVAHVHNIKEEMTLWLAKTIYVRELVDTLGLYSDSPEKLEALIANINDNEELLVATIVQCNPLRKGISLPGRILLHLKSSEGPKIDSFEMLQEKIIPPIRILITLIKAFKPTQDAVETFVNKFSDSLLEQFHEWGNAKITSDDLSDMRSALEDALMGFAGGVEDVLRSVESLLDVFQNVEIPQMDFQDMYKNVITKVNSWIENPNMITLATQLQKLTAWIIKQVDEKIGAPIAEKVAKPIADGMAAAQPQLPPPPPQLLQLLQQQPQLLQLLPQLLQEPQLPPQLLQQLPPQLLQLLQQQPQLLQLLPQQLQQLPPLPLLPQQLQLPPLPSNEQRIMGLITMKGWVQALSEKLANFISAPKAPAFNLTDLATTSEDIKTIVNVFIKIRASFLKQLEPLRTEKPEIFDKIDFWFTRTGMELGIYLEIRALYLLFTIQATDNIPFADTWFDLYYLSTLADGIRTSTSMQLTSVSKDDLIGFGETFAISRENIHERLLGVMDDLRHIISKSDYHIFQHVHKRFDGMANPLLSLVDNLA